MLLSLFKFQPRFRQPVGVFFRWGFFWAESFILSGFEPPHLSQGVDGNPECLVIQGFERFYSLPLLTGESLKRYYCPRLTEQNLENQIQQGFQIERLQLTLIPIRD